MLGAIAGDIIGSVFEHRAVKTTDFPLFSPESHFTDDTVLTVAIADAILHGREYGYAMQSFARLYPDAGYGGTFKKWMMGYLDGPYNSWGNGSAMRVSPVGWAWDDANTVLEEARRSAEVTHNHPEGIKGAQVVATAVRMARQGYSKKAIKAFIENHFQYDLSRALKDIRPTYTFDVSCQGSVPEAIIAFLESSDFEDAVRNAISLGGDADTQAAIAGALAEAFYGGLPPAIEAEVFNRIPSLFTDTCQMFRLRFIQ